ncbi:MAG TPA: DUF4352 domain-containing protein [Candidatus Saccharimonadales bacterium]|nr:DUF4352 domain-containing protein [Candidatus Saccharimonadales bacterium]
MKWFGKHKIVTVVIVVVILAIIGGGVATNNSTTVKTTASTVTNNASPKKATVAKSSPSAAHVGATISLTGQSGSGADVTLVQVLDPATGADQYTTPDAGNRFVGVQLRIKNTSTTAESIAPDNDVTLFDTKGQSYSPDIADSLANCQGFANGGPNLGPGESALGCETFQIPTTDTVAKVEFTPSSGFANDTGEWLVP